MFAFYFYFNFCTMNEIEEQKIEIGGKLEKVN